MGFKPGGTDLSDLEVDSGTLSVDEANNRVGIGTENPANTLHVAGTITAHADYPDITFRTTGEGRLIWEDGGGAGYGGLKMVPSDSAPLRFFTSGVTGGDEKMRIDADGKIGIGTDSPDHLLEVESSSASEPVISIKNTHAGATAGAIRFTKDGASAANDDALGVIDFYGENDNGTPESIQYITIDAKSTDIGDGSESGTLEFKAMVDGSLSTLATLNPESSTANTFCGGFGTKAPVMLAVDSTTLTAAQSGCTVLVTPGVNVKLPTPSPGIWYRFVNFAGTGSGASSITSTTDGSTAEELFFGVLRDTNSFTSGGNADVLQFTTNSTEGDYIEVYCVSATTTENNNTWFYKAVSAVDGAITAT